MRTILSKLYCKNRPHLTSSDVYGYMLAKGKKVLLLKEKAFKNIQADMLGKLWEEFGLDKMGSIQRAIKQWMIDLGMIQIKA